MHRRCPDCGAYLDPEEKCDCKKEKSCAEKNGHSSREATNSRKTRISQNVKIVNNILRELRVTNKIPADELVKEVRKIFPKYDKTLQSKCERTEEYAVELCRKALDALLEKYDTELLDKAKKMRNGYHKLTKQVTCRLDDETYDVLQSIKEREGYETVQAFMTDKIINYIKENSI